MIGSSERSGYGGRRDERVTGLVVAGGRSLRMGLDKRGVLVDGVPMLRRTALSVCAVADEILIACRRGAEPAESIVEGLGARLVYDERDDAGPLAGVEAGLRAASGDLVLVVAGDMPFVAPEVLALLVDEAAGDASAVAVALETRRGPEPLLAVYRREPALRAATALLDRGASRMHGLLESVPCIAIPESRWAVADPTRRTAVNVNEPGDLAER